MSAEITVQNHNTIKINLHVQLKSKGLGRDSYRGGGRENGDFPPFRKFPPFLNQHKYYNKQLLQQKAVVDTEGGGGGGGGGKGGNPP